MCLLSAVAVAVAVGVGNTPYAVRVTELPVVEPLAWASPQAPGQVSGTPFGTGRNYCP